MKTKNQILNYFVVPPLDKGDKARVFLSPVTMNASIGKKIIESQTGIKSSPGSKYLHVCFDLDSRMIYIPNASEFTSENMKCLLDSAKERIQKDFGDLSNQYILGSPFSSIRIRSINSFSYVKKCIQETFNGFEDITVIEANLARMPTTAKSLPCIYHNNKNFVGGYISEEVAEYITFYDEIDIKGKKNDKPFVIHKQKTPFILIDISPSVNPSITEKEWSVLSGYRDYVYNKKTEGGENQYGTLAFADIFAIKRHLYLGWTFEELCSLFLEGVDDFGELIQGIRLLNQTAKILEREGYSNPARNSYFMTFKIDPLTFPLKLESVMNEDKDKFDPSRQISEFQIIDYDPESKKIIVETPAFISENNCFRILKVTSRPFIAKYNPTMKTIDVKSPKSLFKELEGKQQIKLIKYLVTTQAIKNYSLQGIENIDFRVDDRTKEISLANNNICHIRKLSEYHYACDHIKKMCEKRKMEFVDIDVLIGPLERIFGRGVKGGFMGKKQFLDSKMKIPHQIVKGLWVTPPIMAVDSVSMPSYSKQTETLIHEYSHNLYNIMNPNHEHLYNKKQNKKLQDTNTVKYWELYLGDEDEKLAHKEEIKYQILSGLSVDEIIRDKIGGKIDSSSVKTNYPIALIFKKIVEEAISEMEENYA